MNIDEHPLRYSGLANAIETVLFRRALEGKLDGHTLPTSLEIADAVVMSLTPDELLRLQKLRSHKAVDVQQVSNDK